MKHHVTLLVLVAFVFTTLLGGIVPTWAAANSKRQYSLAVLDLDISGTIARDDAVLMSRQLREELRVLGIFDVMDRLTMVSRLQDGGILEPSCATMACAAEAGAKLGVQLVVGGSVRRVGQTYYIDAFMVHVATGEEVETVSDQFRGTVDQLIGYMAVVAKKLVGVPVRGQQPSTPAAGQTTPSTSPIFKEDGAGKSKWLRYTALGVLGAGGVAAVIIAATSGGSKPGTTTSKLPDPPGFPGNP